QWWLGDGDRGDYAAIGILGQFVYVSPADDIVIVTRVIPPPPRRPPPQRPPKAVPGAWERTETRNQIFRIFAQVERL
ncbi:hypothetical protein, partial [Nocardia farcinica]|uniref:hypothetical protein n=1 Tax=Nocardia farcinica TaxID=37329 RepID=UPI0024558E99